MSFARTLSAPDYIQSRHRDFNSLTHEISQAPAVANGKDLGYCMLIDGNCVLHNGKLEVCESRTEALAFILRKFW